MRCRPILATLWAILALTLAPCTWAQTSPPPAEIWRTYEFQVVSSRNVPVAGATVRPWQVAYGRGSMGMGDELQKPFKTDAEGRFQVVIRKDAPFIEAVEMYGIRSLAFSIDHLDFPAWSDYVPVGGDQKIVLADPATVIVRVQPPEGEAIQRGLYPVPATSDWSEADGVVTIRRVDLVSKNASPWLRIVHAPDKKPIAFTDLINVREHQGPTISLDVKLQPTVRVVGSLAENATRPIKNGRVLATIIAGGRADGRSWWWNDATDIDEEGNFVFESLPAGDTLQMIALCEGWVSASTTSPEVKEYGKANNFATAPIDDPEMQAGGRVYPRLLRLNAPQVNVRIPMEATLSCIVTVVDGNDVPIPDVSISFWPNQYWFEGGSQILGTEINFFSKLRRPGDKSGPAPTKYVWSDKFDQQTDAGGMALITGLPFAFGDDATLTREFEFDVSHDDYKLVPPKDADPKAPADESLTVKIEPGQIGQVTVRMQPK